MSKKSHKSSKANNTAIIKVEVSGILIASYDYLKNTLYCPCGGKLYWTGGRYSHNRTMEVLKCEHCGRHTDPRMVVETALKTLHQWETARSNYFRNASNRAAAAYNAEHRAIRAARQTPAPRQGGFFGFVRAIFA